MEHKLTLEQPVIDAKVRGEKLPSTGSSDASLEPLDHAFEKKVVRKTDLHLIPVLFLLFLCAFVDR